MAKPLEQIHVKFTFTLDQVAPCRWPWDHVWSRWECLNALKIAEQRRFCLLCNLERRRHR